MSVRTFTIPLTDLGNTYLVKAVNEQLLSVPEIVLLGLGWIPPASLVDEGVLPELVSLDDPLGENSEQHNTTNETESKILGSR